MDFSGEDLVRELPPQLQRAVSLQTHEVKLRRFALFDGLDERFVAELATRLRPEVYLPDEYILVLGQVSHSAYFIERGRVHILWRSAKAHSFAVRTDYFGELGLFQAKQHLYSARAMTHLDVYSLHRDHFRAAIRDNPAEAVQIADRLHYILPKSSAKMAVNEIFETAGVARLLRFFTAGEWRPRKGLAAKIAALGKDPAFRSQLHRRGMRRRSADCSRVAAVAASSSTLAGGDGRKAEQAGGGGGGAGGGASNTGDVLAEAESLLGGSSLDAAVDWSRVEAPSPPARVPVPRRRSRELQADRPPPQAGGGGGAGAAEVAALSRSHETLRREVGAIAESQKRIEALLATLASDRVAQEV
jgi:CRP-like cAMP-binding protein